MSLGASPIGSIPIASRAATNVAATVTVDAAQGFAVYNKVPVNVTYSTPSGVPLYVGRAALPDFFRAGLTIYALNPTNYIVGWPRAYHVIGATYQYSVDGGLSWQSAGSALYAQIDGRTPGAVDQVWVRALDALGNASGALTIAVALPALGSPVWYARTIGTGGYYPTPGDWEADTKYNLVSNNHGHVGLCLAQEFAGTYSVGAITIAGATTDSTHYRHLTASPGCSFKDHVSRRGNPLRYNPAVGASITTNQGNLLTHCVGMHEAWCRVSRLQVECSGNSTTGWGGYVIHSSSATYPTLLEDFICKGGNYEFILSHNYGQIARRGLVYSDRPASAQGVNAASHLGEMNNGCLTYNVNFVALAQRYPVATVARTNNVVFKNCGFFGVDLVQDLTIGGSESPGPAYTTCFSDAPTRPSGVSFCAFDTGTFESISASTPDLRLKIGSPMCNVGTYDATNGPRDISGWLVPVSSNVDAGPWQTS